MKYINEETGVVKGFQFEGAREMTVDEWELFKNPQPTTEEITLAQISLLESKQTPRRLREAALGNTDSIAFLQDIDDQISELRKSLST